MKTDQSAPARIRTSAAPAIAAAARALIAERGFEGLRTRDIAERVGINVATLHYHVPTKEALIEIVAQSMRDDFIAQSKAWRRDGLTPLQELQARDGRTSAKRWSTIRSCSPCLPKWSSARAATRRSTPRSGRCRPTGISRSSTS